MEKECIHFSNVQIKNHFLLALYQRDFIAVITFNRTYLINFL